MSEPGGLGPGRAWRASCTSCGAPVEFRSAASPMAVCSFCRSTLVRDGDALRRIGHAGELFDAHSLLQLGVRGSLQGEPFTLIGRLQYAYTDEAGEEGRWTSWHALFDNGRSAALSEDNGAHVLSWPQAQPEATLPDLGRAPLGSSQGLLGRLWTLSSKVQARVHAAEGECGVLPDLKHPFPVWELRNEAGEVLSIEPAAQPPRYDVGRAVRLDELKLSGLRDPEQTQGKVKAAGLSCPNCGSGLNPTLDNTRTITCGSCRAVVDIGQGLGGQLAFYKQFNALEPLIPLGQRGALSLNGRRVNWQVVGYQERCTVAMGDDESWFWREYLLHHPTEGFAFLVDSEDGWSLVRTEAGVPKASGPRLRYRGVDFKQVDEAYAAKTTHVLGEFYWPVRRDQRSQHADYTGRSQGRDLRLNREQAGQEITWSLGEALDAADVMKAFAIQPQQKALFKRDAQPASAEWSFTAVMMVVVVIVFVLLIISASSCEERCGRVRDTYGEASLEYQQCRQSSGSGGGYGGSYGGYSSGGFHK